MSSTQSISNLTERIRAFINGCESSIHSDRSSPTPGEEEEFNSLALALFSFQFERNQPYRYFCESRRVRPQNVTHWNQIPAIPTSAFKELELSCLPVEERSTVFYSSGTTGQQPSRH